MKKTTITLIILFLSVSLLISGCFSKTNNNTNETKDVIGEVSDAQIIEETDSELIQEEDIEIGEMI